MSQAPRLDYEDRRQKALAFFDTAYRTQKRGELSRAEELYRRAVALYPTAESFTFLGWALSLQGRLEEAIECCRRAIELDPDYGNPYNDLGAYLIELGRPDEAVPFLKKAIAAPRYECYYYAHYNLGRVWELRGRWREAARQYGLSLEKNPYFQLARHALERVTRRLSLDR
ncbi:MAG: tetratricopeptide repeat protein [Planctomycetota bacterium]